MTTAEKSEIAARLGEFGLVSEPSGLRRSSLACVALPTCGQALAEAERYLPNLVAESEGKLSHLGLRDNEPTVA